MDKIFHNESRASEFEKTVLLADQTKKQITKSFFNNAGIFVGVLLMFAVIVIVTTDIKIISFEHVAELGLDFFLLLFASYSAYISCSDSGMRAGLQTDTYTMGVNEYDKHKKHIITEKMQARLGEFCYHYITEELRSSRTGVLAVVGISYERYMEEYVGKDKNAIDRDSSLSDAQKKAIVKANKFEPIKLTPEMIMKRGRGGARRTPLGMTPETKKGIAFGVKFIRTFFLSIAFTIIVLDAVQEPTWLLIATCCMKLMSIVMNGFYGYKCGYENVVIDTVNYMSDQADLMAQFEQYIENNPARESGE